MGKLKIIFLEKGEPEKKKDFASDAKEVANWVKKVLDDSPDTKMYSFKENENSKLLKIFKDEVPNLCIEFLEEKQVENSLQESTPNVICAILCNDGQILGTQLGIGTQVPANYFSSYTQAKKLARYINDI